MDVSELQKQALALGIKIDRRWGPKKLSEAVALAGLNPCQPCVTDVVGKEEKQPPKTDDKDDYYHDLIDRIHHGTERPAYKNISQNNFTCRSFVCDKGATVEMQDHQLADSHLMKVLDYQVTLGQFERVV